MVETRTQDANIVTRSDANIFTRSGADRSAPGQCNGEGFQRCTLTFPS